MHPFRTQESITKIRIIPAHIDKTKGIPISKPFMGLEKPKPSRLRALIFTIFKCIVIHPFSVVLSLTPLIYKKDPPNSFLESDGSVERRERRTKLWQCLTR